MTTRLLIIALDGADGGMLDQGSRDGSLPNLAALRGRGEAKAMAAPASSTDDGLWASFHYAQPLGEHGRYHYLQPTDWGGWTMAFEDERETETFWQALSRQGQRVAVFDAPKCAPPRVFEGLHLADWLAHGKYFAEPLSHPPELADEVVAAFGPAPRSLCSYHGEFDDEGAQVLSDSLSATVAMKRAAVVKYLTAEPWDLFVAAFKEGHCAGHGLWDRPDRVGATMAQLDAAVGALIAAAGPEAAVVAFTTTTLAPNGVLEHLEAGLAARLNARLGETWLKRKARGAWRRLTGKRVPPPLTPVPVTDNCLAYRLRDRERTLETVQAMLAQVVDAADGQPVAASFSRPSSEEAGARAALLPDLVLHCRQGVRPAAVTSPWLGRIEAPVPLMRPGNHVGPGFVISAGASLSAVEGMEDFGALAGAVLGARG